MAVNHLDLHIRQGEHLALIGANGAGKTPEQIRKIASAMYRHGQNTVLITRMSSQAAELAGKELPLRYDELSRVGVVGDIPVPDGEGKILVATGGTSDMPVAEEAALTAQAFGNDVIRLYDVGVAGLHRLLSYMDEIMSARVIIAIAGMEGALASVVNIDNGFGAGYLTSMINHIGGHQ